MSGFIVYRALCQITGKSYIGCTRRGLVARRAQHLYNAAQGKPSRFYQALRQHGPSSFTWSILGKYPDAEAMFTGERQMIAHYQTATTGYNTTLGGHNGHLNVMDRYYMSQGAHSAKRLSGA
jgi:GIY-YIG catalytic domain.